MQNQVNSVNPNMKFQPNPRQVVCPPPKVYKYSMYDELKLGEDKYKEIKSALVNPKTVKKPSKTESVLQKVFTLAILGAACVLGYKNREKISELFKKIPQIFGKK